VSIPLDANRRPSNTPIWKLDAFLNAPPVHMTTLTRQRGSRHMRGYTQTTMIGDHASPGPITFSIRSSAARVALSRTSELETWTRNDLLRFGPRRLFLAKDLMSPSVKGFGRRPLTNRTAC
jgi:hypothetical protein